MRRKYNIINPLIYCSGIYLIKSKNSEKVYIGESYNVAKRIQNHFYHLRNGSHANIILQNIYNKHKEDTFEVYILENLGKCKDKNILLEKEAFYQSNYKTCINFDYNSKSKTYLHSSKLLEDENLFEYKLINVVSREVKSFKSKSLFSLFFSDKVNTGLYDKYLNYIDNLYYTAKNINNLEELLDTEFIYRNSKNYKLKCKLGVYLNALKTFKTNSEFAKKLGINRHLVTELLKEKSIQDRITEVELICSHFKTPLNGGTPNSDLDNPVLTPQEIEENAERLEVMPNE